MSEYKDKDKDKNRDKDKRVKTKLEKNLKPTEIKKLAWLELNLLNYSRSLEPTSLEGARLETSTPVYDTNGELLFHRFPLVQNGSSAGYADVAAHTALGAPLLAVAPLAPWNEQAVLTLAQEAYRQQGAGGEKGKHQAYDELRFVAYSYPKLAVQFLKNKKEVEMLECFTWIKVPPAKPARRQKLAPANFERWSLLDELPEARKRENHAKFEGRAAAYGQLQLSSPVISRQLLEPNVSVFQLTRAYEIHYSGRSADHHVCYELRGQETNVWCVAASVQMLLDFYRYNYTQSRIANALGLGTVANPSGLPYGSENLVVTQLDALSSNALTAGMIPSPAFGDYISELDQNRPMISFIPGHSRTVAGCTESVLVWIGQTGFRGLLVYDPWPPNAGVITRWENYDAMTYRFAFSARVTMI